MVCAKYIVLGLARTIDGDFIIPLFPDEDGTWDLVISDVAYPFEADTRELIVVEDNFTDNAENIFQLRRPDGTVYNNTCYSAYIDKDIDEFIPA